MRRITKTNLFKALDATRRDFHGSYYAMYSSLLGGIVTDPSLMLVPADDHVVHRGDGVFETLKCLEGNVYNMRAHLDRLARSAAAMSLPLPFPVGRIGRLTVETIRAGGRRNAFIRLIVSRGPGSFGVSPLESPASQLYIVVYRMPTPFMETHAGGARIGASRLPVTHTLLVGIKTCNYGVNVMMKKECIDRGLDFIVGFDEQGHLTEGPTENAGIVSASGALLFPRPGMILAGTTMLRAVRFAAGLVRRGMLRRVAFEDISRKDVLRAREVLIVGTGPHVTAAIEFDGRKIGNGKPGPVQQELNRMLERDMRNNTALLTPVFGTQPGRRPDQRSTARRSARA